VRAAGHNDGRVLGSALTQTGGDGDAVAVDVFERTHDLQLLDVLGEVAAGHALVDLLVPGKCVEFLDACLHVVAGDPLAVRDGLEVDVVDDTLVVVDGVGRNVDAQLCLRTQHRHPQLTLEHDLVLGRPQSNELRAGVAVGKDIRDAAHEASV